MNWTDFLSSSGGGAIVSGGLGFLGGLLGGLGQADIAEQNAKLTREQLAQQQKQFEAQQLQARQLAGLGITDPSKLQNWRQQQAVTAAIMPGLRNFSVGTPQGMESFRPQVSGGFRIPEGGFDASTLAFFSPEARAAAEGTFWQAAAPFVKPPDLTQVGYGAAGQDATNSALAARQAIEGARSDAVRQSLLGRGRPMQGSPVGKAQPRSELSRLALLGY